MLEEVAWCPEQEAANQRSRGKRQRSTYCGKLGSNSTPINTWICSCQDNQSAGRGVETFDGRIGSDCTGDALEHGEAVTVAAKVRMANNVAHAPRSPPEAPCHARTPHNSLTFVTGTGARAWFSGQRNCPSATAPRASDLPGFQSSELPKFLFVVSQCSAGSQDVCTRNGAMSKHREDLESASSG